MYTEEEARLRWCPMKKATHLDTDEHGVRGGDYCIASSCMMWRWGRLGVITCEDIEAKEEPSRPAYIPPAWVFVPAGENPVAGWQEPENEPDRGYCGLAENP